MRSECISAPPLTLHSIYLYRFLHAGRRRFFDYITSSDISQQHTILYRFQLGIVTLQQTGMTQTSIGTGGKQGKSLSFLLQSTCGGSDQS